MTSNASSFKANLSRGVEHLAETDIETIRDLLRGYGSSKSILKELIQNAEDAGASRLDFVYLPANKNAQHSLTRGPGLLAVNPGPFTNEHREAIFQINLGTKGTDDRAIGRFGKGLKSVFAWCEAFFVIAHTDSDLGWPVSSITDLFNPWQGWRHANWKEEFDQHFASITARAQECISSIYPENTPWLAFWFPLRCELHKQDAEDEEIEWIVNSMPGDDSNFMTELATGLRELAPSLVNLRHLERITMGDEASVTQPSVVWHLLTSQRIPAPDDDERLSPVTGEASLHDHAKRERRYRYTGLAGRLPTKSVIHLEEAPDWPKVVQRIQGRSRAGCKAKGKPHFATLITSDSTNENETQGSLEVRWCVFFPVGSQPGTSEVRLTRSRRHITVNLHGFFFLDSERLRIDGLEHRFSPNGATSNRSCLEWNRIVATQGTLACLPKSLAEFAKHESLTPIECRDLADAMRKTWVWAEFQKDVCRSDAWRPRWQSGDEFWGCISADIRVLHIPATLDPRGLLQSLPVLAPISEERTLVAQGNDAPPGLYTDEFSRWPEDLVLRLFKDVQPGSIRDEATASWINAFLDLLGEHETLTPAIRDQVSTLPLLPVTDARTKLSTRVSAREWASFSANGRLFEHGNDGSDWRHLLCDALPEWSCFLTSSHGIPRWFRGTRIADCNAGAAAATVLTQTAFGTFPARAALVLSLAQESHWNIDARPAMRYLMHTSEPNARGSQTLFVPSSRHGQQIWSRVIEQLLAADSGAQSWRLLHTNWGAELSPDAQQKLGVYTIDAEGTWKELASGEADLDALRFPTDLWSHADVSAMLKGLFEAGQNKRDATLILLRKLRLHTQRGALNERVSVADKQGGLDDLFVLDKSGFEDQLPEDLKPLWQSFLAETKIIERLPENDLASTVQRYLFERLNADNTRYYAELDWNYVVRRSLAATDPSARSQLILEALSHGDQAASGLGQQLKRSAWLPLSLAGTIAPQSVVAIEGLEEELHRLLDPVKDGLAGIRALPEWISKHDGFLTLRKYLPGLEEAIKLLGLWLEEKADWHLGLSRQFQPVELWPILSELSEFENLPAASLLTSLRRVRSRGYDEGVDPLLKDYILPSLLKRFDYSRGGLDKLENILHRLQGQPSRGAFNAYLSQACQDEKLATLLGTLSLVNQLGQWVPARELIWPSANLDLKVQLCKEQADILAAFHTAPPTQELRTTQTQATPSHGGKYSLSEAPDFGAEVAKLSDFLRPFRNGNVGDNLPAALVAVLGGHPKMLVLLRELLQSALRQQPEDFLALLLAEQNNSLAYAMHFTRFLIETVKGGSTEARTITGETIRVDLTQEVTTLIVGDPNDLWWSYNYQSPGNSVSCHLLRLRWIDHPDELPDPVAVFASTIETILLKVDCNGVASRCPTGIKEVLGNVADSGQADLRRSREYLLDMAEARLKELGVRNVPEVDLILQTFSDARQARVDAALLETRVPARAQQRRDEARTLVAAARKELVALLETTQDNTARRALVDAIRRKMTAFEYNIGSVAFELFQNADDAVAELAEMQQDLDTQARQFVLQFDSQGRILEIIHWGRPINQHEYPGFLGGPKRGYDQDLQKMLTLNFSDKGVSTGDAPAVVTGRFGLGFKSVFFVSEGPEVISGRLAFEIRGGFFPVALSQAVAEEMRNKARAFAPPSAVPTAIRLKASPSSEIEELSQAVDKFSRIAPLLTIFSRQIRTVILAHDRATKTWTNVEEKLTESGRITYARIGSTSFVCFRCLLSFDQHPATVLFQSNSSGISELASELTGLWITAPTAERSELRWAVNAPFKPDAGRQRLALNNPENRNIAEEVADIWGHALLELFDLTSTSWNRFAELSGLHAHASSESWWQQIWKQTTRSKPLLQWEGIREGGQVLNWIAWGKPVGAMRRLVQQRAAIPSELPDAYLTMVTAENVRFCLSGLLAATGNGCFAQVGRWESTQISFPPGRTVNGDIGAFLREAELGGIILSVTLEQVLASEIGPQQRVDNLIGERVGTLFNECKSVFEPSTAHAVEVQHLFTWMKQASMLGADRAYHPVNELICSRALAGVIDADEALRAAFAPDLAVLSTCYSDMALGFFVRARGQLAANATTLATWAREVSSKKLLAVFKYLITGELGQHLADQLGRPWLDVNRGTPAWQRLSAEDKNEVERKFSKGYAWISPPPPDVLVPQPGVRQEMDAGEAFELISQWWQKEQTTWASRYEGKTYPAGFPGSLPWPEEDGWDTGATDSAKSRWLILFIHAALVPLGFNMIGRDQTFSQFLVSNNWLDVLAKVSEAPTALLAALDQYLDGFIENTQYHFQMRQFVAFYAIAKNLETFLFSLKEAERSESAAMFRMAFAPKANFAFMGTGINAPPLTGMLGIGSCQLFRELYRLGRLSNPLGYPFAFTPIRKVRRLCTQLFGTPEGPAPQSSEMIFQKLSELGERLGLDPTFGQCFDLPLQFLAQDKDLRTRVLNVTFEAESGDDDTLDASPSLETAP